MISIRRWFAIATACHFGRSVAEYNCTGQVVTINAFRHAFSCENTLTDCSSLLCKALVLGMEQDGPITDLGIQQSQTAASELTGAGYDFDVILTSAQFRTMETALYMFPNRTVYQMPYVKEVGPLPGELPRSIVSQQETLQQFADPGEWVDFSYVEKWGDKDCTAISTRKNPRCKANWNDFLSYFANLVAANPMPEIEGQVTSCKDFSVALVTHSVLMARFLNIKDVHVANNGGYTAQFAMSKDTDGHYKLVRHGAASDAPWEQLAVPTEKPIACADGKVPAHQDIERCYLRDAKTFESAADCWSDD